MNEYSIHQQHDRRRLLIDLDGSARASASGGIAGDTGDGLSLMMADSILPDEIRPPGAGLSIDHPRHALLTGATGFLGAYLLRTLLLETRADVHCLVRPARGGGLARIQNNLERYNLWQPSLASRVHVVVGNLSQPNMGLPSGDYDCLSGKLDAIYHAAANVNWLVPYRSLRKVNVGGTRELIRLACAGRAKAFHFISSLSVCCAIGASPGRVREDFDMLPFVKHLPLGYAQSKCVAESLVRQASARGLSASIHRPSFIGGDSITGASNLDDLVAALFKGCIQMGAAPDLDWELDAPPVDHVARAIIHLPQSKRQQRPEEPFLASFHLNNGHPRHWRECVLWMNLFGYPVKLLPYKAWRERLADEAQAPGHALHRLRSFFLRCQPCGNAIPELYQEGRRSAPDCLRTRQAEITAGLDCPPLDAGLLNRYFNYYIERGFLPAPRSPSRKLSSGSLEPTILAPTKALVLPKPRRKSPMSACFEDRAFIERILRRHFGDDSLRLCDLALLTSGSEHSIIGELSSWRHRRRTGLFHCRLTLERQNTLQILDLMVKAKPADYEMIEVAETMASICGSRLATTLHDFRDQIGMKEGHLREPAIYEQADERLRRFMPICFGAWRDDELREWGMALEYLKDLELMNATEGPAAWSGAHMEAAITGLAEIHAGWYGREAKLRRQPWIGHTSSLGSMVEMTPLWQALAEHAAPYFADWAGPGLASTHRRLVDSISEWWQPLESGPRTLIHNDFNPRNVALRRDGPRLQLCAYDWELATLGVPQRDLAEFLCFVLPSNVSEQETSRYVELHRRTLAEATGHSISACEWRLGLRSALADLLVNRLAFYAMINRVRPQPFLPRVARSWQRLNEILADEEPTDNQTG